MAVTCGFNWGFSSADACTKAKMLTPALADLSGESRTKQEDRILGLCPDGSAGHFVLGLRHERQKEVDEAIAEYRAALENDENIAEAHGNLGLLLLKKGARDEAVVELSRGLMGKADPRNHRGLADVYYNLGRLDEAEEEFKSVLVENPSQVSAHIGLAEVYKKGKRFDEAIAELHKVASTKSRDREIHRLLAEVYRAKGELAQAGKEYLLAGIDQTSPLEEYIRKGDEYLISREYEKAIEMYQDAIIKRPDWTKALEKLGDAHMAAGNDDEAIAVYQKILSLDGGNSGIHYSLGVLFERQGALDKAVAEYQESLRLDPDNGDTHRRLADIYTLRGKNQLAIEEYKKLVALRADNPHQLPPGHYTRIAVEDCGCGISQENLVRIFDPYFTTKPKGSGLGLASVYSIVKRHGGAVEVSSILGSGTTFTIHIPAIPGRLPEDTGVNEPVELRGRGRVLVMDDEDLVREIATYILGFMGYEVATCADGQEAVELFRAALTNNIPFSAVILDLTIPGGVGGKETAARIMEIDPDAVLIVSSGYSSDPVIANFRHYGFSGVVSKPFDTEGLARELKRLVPTGPPHGC